MKKNMGTVDKIIRIVIALVIGVLYYAIPKYCDLRYYFITTS